MGKRSNFERNPRDFYPTPFEAVKPLVEHGGFDINTPFFYAEPCAGDGRLVRHLDLFNNQFCNLGGAYDIEPKGPGVMQADVFGGNNRALMGNVITNPPWDRKFLHPFIAKWIRVNNIFSNTNLCMWLLFDADWMHTKQSREFMPYCDKIISVGRVKWIEGSKNTGKDNCCWYRFRTTRGHKTEFVGR